jgi:hypothetical protein
MLEMARPDTSEPDYLYRCCRCFEDESLKLRTAKLMRLVCEKHGATLHQKWVKNADGSFVPAA